MGGLVGLWRCGWGGVGAEWPTQAGLHARHHINPSQAVGGGEGVDSRKEGEGGI